MIYYYLNCLRVNPDGGGCHNVVNRHANLTHS